MKSTWNKVEDNVAAPTNAELAQNMAQLVQTIGNVVTQNQHQQRLYNRNDVAKLVAKRNPPCYLGQEDPLILEDWIRTFDKLFEAINCPADQQNNTAAYYLVKRRTTGGPRQPQRCSNNLTFLGRRLRRYCVKDSTQST
ncbi:unnamed protein product [Cuscuta europaea]|uniref:Uncharacterized protein n=1 Tax=Cuscuta europaea TaxID=41803 RepID=A0A9P0ZA30_CUSEU|nr:unnamed protein product [Cuscuta europaea]